MEREIHTKGRDIGQPDGSRGKIVEIERRKRKREREVVKEKGVGGNGKRAEMEK